MNYVCHLKVHGEDRSWQQRVFLKGPDQQKMEMLKGWTLTWNSCVASFVKDFGDLNGQKYWSTK